MASEKSINIKKEQVSDLASKMKEAKLILLTDYRGINVEDVTSLRNDLRNAKAEYKVIKILPRLIPRPFTVKVNGEKIYSGEYIKKYVRDGLYSFTTLQG